MVEKKSPIYKMEGGVRSVRMLVYADPGTGKTPFAATSPGKMLLLNADGPDGPESARVYSNYQGDVWDIKDYKDLDRSYEYLRARGERYDWVWFDSVTLFQESGMDNIMRDLIASSSHRNPYVPDRLQYVENQNHLATWIRNMIHLPFHFGITAHVMRVEDQDDGSVTYMPAIQGGGQVPMTTRICGHMSIVARLYVATQKTDKGEKRVRVLQTARDNKWYAKDRFGALAPKIANPSMVQVMDALNSKEGA